MADDTAEIWSYDNSSLPIERKISGNNAAEYIFDTVTTLSCKTGYGLNGAARTKKCNDGHWDDKDNRTTACIKVCSNDPTLLVAGGYIRETNHIGRTGNFYKLDGSSIASNAVVLVNDKYNAAIDATLDGKCNSTEYYEYENYSYKCTASGWQQLGDCRERSCSNKGTDLDSSYHLNTVEGETTSRSTKGFSCATNYSFGKDISGSMTMYCLKGVWSKNSGETKICYENCGTTADAEGELWSYNTTAIDNGNGVSWYIKGTTATQSCKSGYTIDGSVRTRVCGATATWGSENGSGVCKKNCKDLTAVTGGTWLYQTGTTTNNRTHKSIATLSCATGYTISSTVKETTCTNGSWSPSPICNANPCTNGDSKISSDFHAVTETDTTNSGNSKTFTCSQGYSSTGANGGDNNGTITIKCNTGSWSAGSDVCCKNSATLYKTPSTNPLTIADCVEKVTMQAWGGVGGASEGGRGGLGGYTAGVYTPGASGARTLSIRIGGGGAGATCSAGPVSGGGGNYGAVVLSGGSVLVAGGGGGGASAHGDDGGYGGGNNNAGGDGKGKEYGYGGRSSSTSVGCVTGGVCGWSNSMDGGSATVETKEKSKYCGGGGGGGVYGGGAGSWGSENHAGGGGGGGFYQMLTNTGGISGLSRQPAKIRILQGKCSGHWMADESKSNIGKGSYTSTEIKIPACASEVFIEIWGGKGDGSKGGHGGYSYGTYDPKKGVRTLYVRSDYGGDRAKCNKSYSYYGGNAAMVSTSSGFERGNILLVAGGGGGASEGDKYNGGYGGDSNGSGGSGSSAPGKNGCSKAGGGTTSGVGSCGGTGKSGSEYRGGTADSKGERYFCGGGGGGGWYGGASGETNEDKVDGQNYHCYGGGGGGSGYCNTSKMTDCGGSSGENYRENVTFIISWY
jgi:hypothetical protein